ncbi:MAG: lactonase family protein [Bacteroidota bacterium]
MRSYSLILAILLLGAMGCSEKKTMAKKYQLFVGTYTDGDSKGIYRFTFDAGTGELAEKTLMAELPNPSFLKISLDKKHLYAVQETADFDSLGGGVTAFKLQDSLLELQNSAGTRGAHPCHVSLSEDGFLAASNYSGGNVSIFKLKEDGSLPEQAQLIDHKALDTTKTAHAHMANFTADGLFVADLGLDAVKRYQLQDKLFVPSGQASLNMAEGAGPRHFTFGKTGILYIINELNSTVTVLKKNGKAYEEIQTIGTLAEDFDGDSFCADIHLSADGRFLYGTNRGENSIVVFSVDGTTGKLSTVGRTSVQGDWPRNFSLDPSGNFLLVANQRSNNISIFSRDGETGTLTFLREIQMGSPVCLEFLD